MFEIKVLTGGDERTIKAEKNTGRTLKALLEAAGIPVSAPCGGKGICGRCAVLADGKKVLSCKTVPDKDMTVRVYIKDTDVLINDPVLEPEPLKEGLGAAFDIGTTTVAAFLYDLRSGECLSKAGAPNAQRQFGDDVISRIRYAEDEKKLLRLTALIREEVYDLLSCMLEKAAKRTGAACKVEDVRYVAVAGNTVMQHIFAAISPKSIGEAPFRPVSLFGEEILAKPTMYFCPCIAGYVGGDTTAGILSSGIYKAEDTVLFADLGTNCEFALGNKDGFLTCSAPAGPAFECGDMDKELRGSELIDTVAGLLDSGAVDETGRLLRGEYEKTKGELPEISGRDVRSLQLAKAAVRAAVETLLKLKGIKASDVGRVLIAGGFGMYIDPESAFRIGMFPEEFRGKLSNIGNSAGAGACMALSEKNRRKLKDIALMCRYEELSGSALFSDEYIDAMEF